ncbi:hypothetical protein bpmyx0001_7520 [Bacillus pseudomycoides DSM 12442]|nr:hypothetical protein bpmyx0001_7520 [Bacillus pseudomycoides DSM 12442]
MLSRIAKSVISLHTTCEDFFMKKQLLKKLTFLKLKELVILV